MTRKVWKIPTGQRLPPLTTGKVGIKVTTGGNKNQTPNPIKAQARPADRRGSGAGGSDRRPADRDLDASVDRGASGDGGGAAVNIPS
jgi:hypothetical protein